MFINDTTTQTTNLDSVEVSQTIEDKHRSFVDELLGENKEILNTNDSSVETLKLNKSHDDGAEKPIESVKPRSIAELAEKYQLKLEEVYELEVPMTGDGNKMTIGQLKDSIQELKTFEANKLAFEEDKIKTELAQTRAKDELTSIIQGLRGVIPTKHFETLMKAGQEEFRAKLNAERQKIFEIVPEWNDKDVLAKEVLEINDYLEPYFGKKALLNFNNAQLLRLFRDAAKREARVKAAIAKMTEVAPKSKPASKQTATKSKSNSNPIGKVDPRRAFVDGLFK